jgi:hypothetical protein
MLHFSSLNLYQQLFSGNRSPKKLSRLKSTVKSKFLAKMTTIMRIKMILTKEISFLSYPLFWVIPLVIGGCYLTKASISAI